MGFGFEIGFQCGFLMGFKSEMGFLCGLLMGFEPIGWILDLMG